MGYTTEFRGEFKFDRPLTLAEVKALTDFSEERHGDNHDPYPGYPGFWCDWAPNEAGTALAWNRSEKFYDYVAWLELLIKRFFTPWGVKLNGVVEWCGEDRWNDRGKITVNNNVVSTEKLP